MIKVSFDIKRLENSNGGQDSDNHGIRQEQGTGVDCEHETGSITLVPGQILQGTDLEVPRTLRDIVSNWTPSLLKSFDGYNGPSLLESFDGYNGSHSPLPNLSLTTQDVTRWGMAWRHAQSLDCIERFWAWNLSKVRYMPVPRCKNWPELDDIIHELPIALGFSATALIYGGLHALAWSAHFESSIEQLLWRISACVVMGGIPVVFVLTRLADRLMRWAPSRLWENVLFNVSDWCLVGVSIIISLAYLLARAYLVVECFINLSHLPAGVYDLPTWSAYFPHIS